MRRLVRFCLALTAAAAPLFLASPPAAACSCLPGTEAEYLARADVVFEGAVTDRAESDNSLTWTVDVDRIVKGAPRDPQAVGSAKDSAACGVAFKLGERYRIFAHRGEGDHLTTSLCSGNRMADPLPTTTVVPSTTRPPTTMRPTTTVPPPPTSTTTTTSTIAPTTTTTALALEPTSSGEGRGGLAVVAAAGVLGVGAAAVLIRRFR